MAVNTIYNGIYPINIHPYIKPAGNKADEKPAETVSEEAQQEQNPFDKNKDENSGSQKEFKSSMDYSSGRVNITQIIADFRNTLIAVAAPKDVEQEVADYLELAELQSQKQKPSETVIKSDLKNAAYILDDYISRTLNRNSKVVLNWVDTLLLQKVDYKAPAKETATVETKKVETNPLTIPVKTVDAPIVENPLIPEESTVQKPKSPAEKLIDIRLANISKKIENFIEEEDYENALISCEKGLKTAQKSARNDVAANLYMDMAFICDEMQNPAKALENYNNAAEAFKNLNDTENEAKAHYNMATIYDDAGKIYPALDHYFYALSLDGELENIKGQSLSLNNIGNVYSTMEEYKTALDFYKQAYALAGEISDNEGRGTILSNVAAVFRDTGNDVKALEYYKNSIKFDKIAENIEGYAKSLEQAGDILAKNGETAKAARLYQNSINAGKSVGDNDWVERIEYKLERMQ